MTISTNVWRAQAKPPSPTTDDDVKERCWYTMEDMRFFACAEVHRRRHLGIQSVSCVTPTDDATRETFWDSLRDAHTRSWNALMGGVAAGRDAASDASKRAEKAFSTRMKRPLLDVASPVAARAVPAPRPASPVERRRDPSARSVPAPRFSPQRRADGGEAPPPRLDELPPHFTDAPSPRRLQRPPRPPVFGAYRAAERKVGLVGFATYFKRTAPASSETALVRRAVPEARRRRRRPRRGVPRRAGGRPAARV